MNKTEVLLAQAKLRMLFDRRKRMPLDEEDKEKVNAIIDELPEDPNRPCHTCQFLFEVNPTVSGFLSCRKHLKDFFLERRTQ